MGSAPGAKRRRPFPYASVALVAILITSAFLVVDLGGNAACHRAYTTFPPCSGATAQPSFPQNATPLILAPQATDSATLSAISDDFAPYLRPNDTLMLSSGAPESNGTLPDVDLLNSAVLQLRSTVPSGIRFEARTAGLASVTAMANGDLSRSYDAILYDYEPNFEPEFTLNFSATLANFEQFAEICHRAGFAAVGYPSSQPLWTGGDASYGWNYGELAATTGVSQLQTQLQGAAHASDATWQSAIGTIVREYAEYDLPASAISVQLTLAIGDPNQIPVETAYQDYEYAVAHGIGSVVIWWNEQSVSQVEQLLGMIR
jgi:hypothetical protein